MGPTQVCGACDGWGFTCYEADGEIRCDEDEFCAVCEGTGREVRDPMRPQTWLEARNERIEAEWGWMRAAVQRHRETREAIEDAYSDQPWKREACLTALENEKRELLS